MIRHDQFSNRGVRAPIWLQIAPAIFLGLWSAGFAFAKLGLAYIEPLTFLALRYAIAIGVLMLVWVILRPPFPRTEREVLHVCVVGGLVQAAYFGLAYIAMSVGVSAGTVALITSLQPILVALLAGHAVGERVGTARWIGLGLGLAGAVLVIASRSAIDATNIAGIGLVFGSLFAMTTATLYEKRFGASHHPVSANLIQYSIGFAVLLPAALIGETNQIVLSSDLVISLAYLVLGNSLIAITLLLAMIRHGEASRVSALFFLVPPAAALIAWVMLGETIPPMAWAGMAVAAAGVALVAGPGPSIQGEVEQLRR